MNMIAYSGGHTGVCVHYPTQTCVKSEFISVLMLSKAKGYAVVFETVSGSPCWPGVGQVAMNHELLTLLLLLPSHVDYRHA